MGTDFFPAWLACQDDVRQQCDELSLPPLLASFGSSLVERAILDGACRRHGVGFARAVRDNLFGIDAGLGTAGAARGLSPREWFPAEPEQVFVRAAHGGPGRSAHRGRFRR